MTDTLRFGEFSWSRNVKTKSAPLEIPTLLKRAAEETLGSVAKKPRFEETQVQMVKEWLDAPKEASETVHNIK
jgi:hypothetical protein